MMPAGFGRLPTRGNKKRGTKGPRKINQCQKYLNYLNLSFGLRLVWNTANTTTSILIISNTTTYGNRFKAACLKFFLN